MNPLTDLPLGQHLREKVLDTHATRHAEDIQRVRDQLHRDATEWDEPLAHLDPAEAYEPSGTLTADDVMEVVEALGLNEGDTRWTGNILKGWGLVKPTDQFVPSRRKSRHAAPVRCWIWI